MANLWRVEHPLEPHVGDLACVDDLLTAWGWPPSSVAKARPLATCFRLDFSGEPAHLLVSPREVRISLESLLKDLVSICLTQLGWYEDDLNRKLEIHAPRFKPRRGMSWGSQLQKLTVGSCNILLSGLLPLAFPEREAAQKVSVLLDLAEELRRTLNPWSHDPPPPPPDTEVAATLAEQLERLLQQSEALMGELPWHLTPSQTSSPGPHIVTGYAWSHRHVKERLIRVVLPDRQQPKDTLLVWNPKRLNPVMTDARVLGLRTRHTNQGNTKLEGW